MHFTQEDYKKIENWLFKNSVKDSEFQEALPLNGSETVVITQNGHNRNMTVQELSNKVLELGVSDFINVSDNFDAYGIDLMEAITLIPFHLRKKGVVITFCNKESNWELHQFTGVLNQWNNVTLWNDIFNIERYAVNSLLPDEEDTTRTEIDKNGNSYLKLKDKEYNPLEFSGYGKKTLRKKIVTVKTSSRSSKRINILEGSVFKDPNTIYEIKYDFDLNNSTVTLPENCILLFNGGKISNGKLNLNNTLVYPLGIVKEDVLECTTIGNFKEGQMFFDKEQGQLSIWDGSSWKSRANYKVVDNKLNETLDGGKTWTPVSDYISANFRWSTDNIIQINRTGKEEDWKDLSYKFANNVFIKGYVASYSALPSNPSLGDIYMVGAGAPYNMYVYTSDGWVDNGSYTSIAAGVVQTTGQSTTEVMSQKVVTDKLTELSEEILGFIPIEKSWSFSKGGEVYESVSVEIPKGESFDINASYGSGTLYYYINGVSKGALNASHFVASENITSLTFYLANTTADGTLAISIDLPNQKGLISNVETIAKEISTITDKIDKLDGSIFGAQYKGNWSYNSGVDLMPQVAIMSVDIKQGETFVINASNISGTLYYYINDVSNGEVANGQNIIAAENINKFSFYLNKPTKNGTLAIVVKSGSGLIGACEQNREDIASLSERVAELSESVQGVTYNGSWAYRKGYELYKDGTFLDVQIPKGSKYVITANSHTGNLYYYTNDVSKGGVKVGEEQVADVDITRIGFYLTGTTDSGNLNIKVTFNGGILGKCDSLQDEIDSLKDDIVGNSYSQINKVSANAALNTTSPGLRFEINVPAQRKFSARIDYDKGDSSALLGIYFYKENKLIESRSIKNHTIADYQLDYDVDSFGIYVSAAQAIASGDAILTIIIPSEFSSMKSDITRLEQKIDGASSSSRVRLADVLKHWLAGERFPIGFHGDSTTDGVATTGWSVANSHPSQDEAVGGTGARGVVDYVCELAYPKQLQNMLRYELKNDNLKIYNIGYYGASLKNNLSQLEAIYSGVYADAKMVGITLSINDRGSKDNASAYYDELVTLLKEYVDFFFSKGITPFMVTQQIVTQIGNNPNVDGGIYDTMYQDYIQILSNKAKEEVAKMYNLEVIDMNGFGRLLMKSSSYPYSQLTEGLHFKDFGHKLEAGFLFSELIPWVNKSDNANRIYWGLACGNSKTDFAISRYYYASHINEFKVEINKQKDSSDNVLIFDSYMFVNSEDGAYNVTYHTPAASGYIIVDNDYNNPISITSTEQNLGVWDIGLHHIQVYTGNSTTIAFRGFILDKVVG